jgi:precorrin-6B methylase 2
MKTFLWIDTNYVEYEILVANANSLEEARESLTNTIRLRLADELTKCQRQDQEQWRQSLKMRHNGWLMYVNKELPTILEEGESQFYNHSNA